MQKALPILYSNYGRYISRFRSIPFYIDCLKPVERRLLLTLYQNAKNGFVTSAKIVGTCIANYHPHGDISTYGALVSLVHNNLAIGQGNWGSPGLNDAPPAAYRYTEIKFKPELEFIMDLLDYVPWEELELEKEPLYLPSPIPVGLIGSDLITGLAFHTTSIPRYKKEDLILRLKWLLENNKKKEKEFGPIIIPNSSNCLVEEESNKSFYNILKNGNGNIIYIPKGELLEKEKEIKILGRAPNSSFNKLINHIDSGKINATILDFSKSDIDILIKPKKKSSIDLQEFAENLWKKYLNKKIKISIHVCDHAGNVFLVGIDELLLNAYQGWSYALTQKLIAEFHKLNERKIENIILSKLRSLIETNKIRKIEDIIQNFKSKKLDLVEIERYDEENKCFVKQNTQISKELIQKIYKNKSISQLIEIENVLDIDEEIKSVKNNICHIEEFCYKKLLSLFK